MVVEEKSYMWIRLQMGHHILTECRELMKLGDSMNIDIH